MKKVVIGIVAKHRVTNNPRPDSLIRDEIKQAIFDNDGVAIGILSPNRKILYSGDNWKNIEKELDIENIIQQMNLCDGIILQGGSTNECYENWIAKYCYENNIPVLGICAGQNCLARALGGTTTKVNNPEKHQNKHAKYVHDIHIKKESLFYSIIHKDKIKVNSRHLRTIENSPYLKKVAFCDDNYSDVIEDKNKAFYLGVRFHPESLYIEDKNMNKIFEAFIKSCEK